MNVYIEQHGKVYAFAGSINWNTIKEFPRLELNKYTPIDNPQFAPGDRMYFEDLKEWTEVGESDNCNDCISDKNDDSICCTRCEGKNIFRKLSETTELEKSPEHTPAAILDNERNRIAHDYMKAILSEGCIPTNDNAVRGDIYVVFAIADAFIARAKQEEKKYE